MSSIKLTYRVLIDSWQTKHFFIDCSSLFDNKINYKLRLTSSKLGISSYTTVIKMGWQGTSNFFKLGNKYAALRKHAASQKSEGNFNSCTVIDGFIPVFKNSSHSPNNSVKLNYAGKIMFVSDFLFISVNNFVTLLVPSNVKF